MLQRFDSSLGKDALNFLPLVGIEIGNNRTQKKNVGICCCCFGFSWDLTVGFGIHLHDRVQSANSQGLTTSNLNLCEEHALESAFYSVWFFCCPLYFRANGSLINLSERDGSK